MPTISEVHSEMPGIVRIIQHVDCVWGPSGGRRIQKGAGTQQPVE